MDILLHLEKILNYNIPNRDQKLKMRHVSSFHHHHTIITNVSTGSKGRGQGKAMTGKGTGGSSPGIFFCLIPLKKYIYS